MGKIEDRKSQIPEKTTFTYGEDRRYKITDYRENYIQEWGRSKTEKYKLTPQNYIYSSPTPRKQHNREIGRQQHHDKHQRK